MKLILLNLIAILLVIRSFSLYNLGRLDQHKEIYKLYEGKLVGFPIDGDQIQDMLNRMDAPQILYLAPRMYYIKIENRIN